MTVRRHLLPYASGLLLGLMLLVTSGEARAQRDSLRTAADPQAAMQAAYERLDYAAAEGHARVLLAQTNAAPDALVDAHTTLGLLLYARNETIEARQQFRAALSLAPDLALDPLLVSPKTLAFFEEVRREATATDPSPERGPAVRYVVVRDLRPGATWRSALLPGWGQWHKGEHAKGWMLLSAWGAGIAVTALAHLQQDRAGDAYRAETDPAQVPDRYATYDAWYRVRSAAALATVTVWSVAVTDALVTGGPDLSLAVGPAQARLRLRF